MNDIVTYPLASDAAMLESLLEKLSDNPIVLTANSRLARYLHSAFQETKKNTARVWETPNILPLATWLMQQFHANNHDGKILLTDFQEHCLWKDIILQHTPVASALLQPAELAQSVQEAWTSLVAWEVPLEKLNAFYEQIEARCLLQWITEFQKQLLEKNWITQAELPRFVAQHSNASQQHFILSGFDDLNPSLKKLFSQYQIEYITPEIISKPRYIFLENAESEIQTMAKWAKTEWLKNPRAKIGCVVLELETLHTRIERIFNETFHFEKVFNISTGTPLSQTNMVKTALSLLHWCIKPLPIQQLAQLLQSPHWCETENDACFGAQCDAQLRHKNYLYVSLSDLFSVAPHLQIHYPKNSLLFKVRQLLQFSRDKNNSQHTPAEWTNEFVMILKKIRWPGVHTQTTGEFQLIEKFKKCLLSFSELNLLYAKIDLQHAWQLLHALAQYTLFQAKSHDEPIQIMGTLEASGISFDASWIMGLHNGVWPQAARPHPLIPYSIQQHYQMPHATAERELHFCKQITHRLKNSAKKVIISTPLKKEDQVLLPSPLIHSLEKISLEDLCLDNALTLPEKIMQTRSLETITEQNAPPIDLNNPIQGGSYILKLQALCPYQAFASIRLQAKKLSEPTLGISAITKGKIIHQILFLIWRELKNQATLNAITSDVLDTLIINSINQAILEEIPAPQESHDVIFIEIEKKRLFTLIHEWLALEKNRPAFSVRALESECEILINQLPLKLRLDRVDELADGSLLLMDYKTADNKFFPQRGEKLRDPQLPLYAAFHHDKEKPYRSMAFAIIKNAHMTFQGIADKRIEKKENKLFNMKPVENWDALISDWKKSLETLADDFCNGKANTNPIEPAVCKQCGLQMVCRYRAEI